MMGNKSPRITLYVIIDAALKPLFIPLIKIAMSPYRELPNYLKLSRYYNYNYIYTVIID